MALSCKDGSEGRGLPESKFWGRGGTASDGYPNSSAWYDDAVEGLENPDPERALDIDVVPVVVVSDSYLDPMDGTRRRLPLPKTRERYPPASEPEVVCADCPVSLLRSGVRTYVWLS